MTSGDGGGRRRLDPAAKGKRKIDDLEIAGGKEEAKKLLEGHDEGSNVISHAEELEEDGFRTPTSSDHRIPAVTECPPAPRKPRPSRSKRRRSVSPPAARRRLELDASEEVQSLFRPGSDVTESSCKRLRRDGGDNDNDRS